MKNLNLRGRQVPSPKASAFKGIFSEGLNPCHVKFACKYFTVVNLNLNLLVRRSSNGYRSIGGNLILYITLVFLIGNNLVKAQEKDLDVYPYWNYYSNITNSLYETLAERAFDQLDERKKLLEGLESKEDWLQRQRYVKSTLEEIVGPFPSKTPLNPVITDTIYRDGMVIEKLYFESRPEYYVTAIFCRPESAAGPLPAILFCSGHTEEGFRSETYQRMIFNYVKKGFAVLAFDPIGQGERKQYLDDQGNPRMGSTKEHSYPGSQAFLAGILPANYFIWDGIRAVDYLLTREEVDPDRLGITGRSGGGTQTAYIAAMDDRLYAAAPECYITTFDKLLKSRGPQDAEQNLMHGIARGIDLPDYIEVRAPKPTLIVSTTRDIFSIQGVRDTYKEAQRTYQALGAPSHIQKVEDDAGHESTKKNREATYAFFREHLRNPGDSSDQDVHIFSEEELWVTSSGNVYTDLGGEDMHSLTLKYVQNQDTYRPESIEDLRRKLIEISGYEPLSSQPEYIFSGRTQYENYAIEKYLVKGSGSYYLPVLWVRPHLSSAKVIMWIDEAGKNIFLKQEKQIERLIKSGYSVVLPDLSGIGELGGGYPGGDAHIQGVPLNVWYAGILTAKSLAAIHAGEMNGLRKFINGYSENRVDITFMSRGTTGTELLLTAFMEGWEEPLVLIESLSDFRSILDDREYDARFLMTAIPGGMQYYDVPELVKAYGDGKILMVDPVNGDNELFKSEGKKNLVYSSDLNDRFNKILSWLK